MHAGTPRDQVHEVDGLSMKENVYKVTGEVEKMEMSYWWSRKDGDERDERE
jgi:hypothetical protein